MPLRSHHVLLFRLVASDCLSCSAALGHSVLSSLALSFSMPLSSCLRLLLSCYSACTLSDLLCHEATSIYRILRSSVAAVTPGHPNQILCPCVCKGQRREGLILPPEFIRFVCFTVFFFLSKFCPVHFLFCLSPKYSPIFPTCSTVLFCAIFFLSIACCLSLYLFAIV